MKISAIIPTFNEAGIITEAIQSALAAGADEVIVCDGGSSDETVNLATGSATQVTRSPIKSRGLQLHTGAEFATGDVLIFVHADCTFDPNTFDQIRNRFTKNIAFGAFKQKIESKRLIFRAIEFGNALRVRCRRLPYGDQAIFAHRKTLDQIGGVPKLPLMEDVELAFRLGKISRPILLPGPVFVDSRRWNENGIIRQTLQNWSLFSKYRNGTPAQELATLYHKKTKVG